MKRDTYIIRFGKDEFGLYARGYRNPSTGTPIVHTGTMDEIISVRRVITEGGTLDTNSLRP